MIVSCDCGARLKVDEAKIAGKRVRVRCPRCGNTIPLQSDQPSPNTVIARPQPAVRPDAHLVLVAHDSEIVRAMVFDVLIKAGFRVEAAADGMEALQKATTLKPRGMVVDVGLPGIYGFELCDRIKNGEHTRDIKIILLSSVYDMRKYKRMPESLYGADDYIEKHHIADFLALKMQKLVTPEAFPDTDPGARISTSHKGLPEMSRPPAREFAASILNAAPPVVRPLRESAPPVTRTRMPARDADEPGDGGAISPDSLSLEASVFQREEFPLPRVQAEDPDAVEKAKRFARIIVSDIALYNQETVVEGILQGTFFELLRNDVDEGRELYEKRVPAAIRSSKDYYQEAFDNFIAAAKRKLGNRQIVR
jgi:predicted Zn finger-like uncharacterized protein